MTPAVREIPEIVRKWRVLSNPVPGIYVLCRRVGEEVRLAPLCVRRLRVLRLGGPHAGEVWRFMARYPRYEDVDRVPDRLRWLRYQAGLTQQEAAERAGVSREVYIRLETGDCERFPLDAMDKLAGAFGVPGGELLDGYNRFLAGDPAREIRELRERIGLSPEKFGVLLGVGGGTVKKWEAGSSRIYRRNWEKLVALEVSASMSAI